MTDTIETTKSTPAVKPTLQIKVERKRVVIIRLLERQKGATIDDMIMASDWKPHSVRAFLSGLRKQGKTIVREQRRSGEQAYRIIKAA